MDKKPEHTINKYIIYGNFEQALNRFDFAKVYRVMSFLDWCWHGDGTPPSQAKMIEMVEKELFKSAIEFFKGEQISVGSGGFSVTIYKGGKVRIEFVVEESHSHDA